jgi:hypothetical protein
MVTIELAMSAIIPMVILPKKPSAHSKAENDIKTDKIGRTDNNKESTRPYENPGHNMSLIRANPVFRSEDGCDRTFLITIKEAIAAPKSPQYQFFIKISNKDKSFSLIKAKNKITTTGMYINKYKLRGILNHPANIAEIPNPIIEAIIIQIRLNIMI